jgi:hypothetical protein
MMAAAVPASSVVTTKMGKPTELILPLQNEQLNSQDPSTANLTAG